MREQQPSLLVRRMGMGLAATVAVLCLLLITTMSALANTVNIYDQAGVLDASQVRNAASSLSYNVDVYSVSGFSGSTSAFNQAAARKIPNSNTIVIAFETNPKHVAIVGGTNVRLSSSQYNDAVNAFINEFKNSNNYTNATVAALRSLNGASGNSGFAGAVPGGGFGIGGGTLCCIGLLVLVALFFVFRRGLFRGNRMGAPGYNQPYNQPYNQGGYPPNYGPGYNQGQGGGINPLAAGGLGAAAGGLIGYELGKEQGERENQGNYGGGGDFGGGASGDFGGDSGGGFGGGGDFGGGAGGDFGGGGGGDFGGGGGGGDFGGGSGGDF